MKAAEPFGALPFFMPWIWWSGTGAAGSLKSNKLPPSVKVFLTFLRHTNRILNTALVDPATDQITDAIVFLATRHEGAGGVD